MMQLGVHRSASIANSIASSGALSAAARVNSDSSDSKDAAAQLKEVAGSSSSWSERKPQGRTRSVDIIPEFAPVREESIGERSDTNTDNSQAPESSDTRMARRSHESAAGKTREGFSGIVQKGADVALSRSDRQTGLGRAVPKRPVHVGFVQPF